MIRSKESKGAFLYKVKLDSDMKTVFQQMVRKAILKHKELDKNFIESTTVGVMDTKRRPINFYSSSYKESVKEAS